VTGVTPITRAGGKQVYQIAFSYRGVQCRELLALPHGKANETYCARLRAEIQGKIERNDFRYSDYFPESPRAGVFGHGASARKVKDALTAFRNRTEKTLEKSTWDCYRRDIDNVLVPWAAERRFTDILVSDLREFVALQQCSLKRIRNLVLPLRQVFDEAVEDGVIPFNPMAKLKLAKLVSIEQRETDYEVRPYNMAELRTLLGNLHGIERWTFQLWAFTGLRTGELIGLRWARLDLEANQLRVTETTTAGEDKPRAKTKAGIRTIPLLPAAREAVEAMREHTQLAADRFTVNVRARRDDRRWDTNKLASVWARAHRGTGIAVRNPYQLRHTFASQLLSQGENVAYIATLMGHKTIEEVTRTYGKWVSEGEKLGFDRPPRQFGMAKLWAEEFTQVSHGLAANT
jgi:integrase